MSPQHISDNLESKVKDIASNLDNDKTILFVLKNIGPLRFTDLEEFCDISRSTLSKYLKVHTEKKEVIKKIYKKDDLQEPRYFITNRGIEKLGEEKLPSEEKIYYFNELNNTYLRLSDLVNFYRKIGVEESIIIHIIKIISKIGDQFFELEQNRDLYITLFYIFYNSTLTPEFKFEINAFCDYFQANYPSLRVKKFKIDYYVDKIMSSKLGFYMFTRGKDIFFFHKEDLLGTTTLRLVKDALIEGRINDMLNEKSDYELDKITEKIVGELMDMKLIWEKIRSPIENLVFKIVVKTSLELGIPKITITNLIVQSKMAQNDIIKPSITHILEGSERYEDLNVVAFSIPQNDSKKIEEGNFCPNCGMVVLKDDFSNKCTNCGLKYKPENLLKTIKAANEVNKKYKKRISEKEGAFICPNPECDAIVFPDMKFCPNCSRLIKKD